MQNIGGTFMALVLPEYSNPSEISQGKGSHPAGFHRRIDRSLLLCFASALPARNLTNRFPKKTGHQQDPAIVYSGPSEQSSTSTSEMWPCVQVGVHAEGHFGGGACSHRSAIGSIGERRQRQRK